MSQDQFITALETDPCMRKKNEGIYRTKAYEYANMHTLLTTTEE